jgi:hypothetical protein
MKRILICSLAIAMLLAVACGGGDKKSAEPTEKPAATAARSEKTAVPTAEATKEASSRSGEGIGALFTSVFSTGLSGGGPGAALGGGDESLKAFLPAESDFPSEFTPFGTFTFSAPASSSELGAVDMAMTMAMKGDPSAFGSADPSNIDLSSIEMLMAMVMRPEDLQAIGEAFDDIKDLDPEDIQDEIDSGLSGIEGFEVKSFEVLDTDGLGDGGFAIEMTIDMSGFASIFGALGGEDAPDISVMTMRMYMFGRGDHIGAVMHMGFSEDLGGSAADDLGLAEVIDGKLEGA